MNEVQNMIFLKTYILLKLTCIVLKSANFLGKMFVQLKKSFYLCINMSIPLPIRTGRLGWTSYLYTNA